MSHMLAYHLRFFAGVGPGAAFWLPANGLRVNGTCCASGPSMPRQSIQDGRQVPDTGEASQ